MCGSLLYSTPQMEKSLIKVSLFAETKCLKILQCFVGLGDMVAFEIIWKNYVFVLFHSSSGPSFTRPVQLIAVNVC